MDEYCTHCESAVSLWMLVSLYGSQVLEMGLFYWRVLNASPLLVKEIKVGDHLLIAYASNARVPCLRLFCAQSCRLEMVQVSRFIMLDHRAEYHHQYGAFLCVRIQVQNLGEPGPVVTSFAKHPGYGHPFISEEKSNVTVNPQFHQACISLPWFLFGFYVVLSCFCI